MIAGVADTHTALWYLFNDGRLSVAAGDFIDKAAAAGSQIVVSSISLAEIVYLIEKNRLPANAYVDLKAALDDQDHVFKEAPFTVEIVDAMKQIPPRGCSRYAGPDRRRDGGLFRRSRSQPRRKNPRLQRSDHLVKSPFPFSRKGFHLPVH